jgi:hypothetical protein
MCGIPGHDDLDDAGQARLDLAPCVSSRGLLHFPEHRALRLRLADGGPTRNRGDVAEQRGLLKRERDKTDRRTQNLRVTRKGDELVKLALGRLLQADREILTHLSEGERHMLLELLHKVARSRKR